MSDRGSSEHRAAWTAEIDAAVERAFTTRFEDLPAEVVAMAKWTILDAVGVAIVGSHEPVTQMLFDEFGGNGDASTLIGRPERSSEFGAAFVNGVSAHSLDFDDWAPVSGAHVSTSLVPAALAVAEQVDATGEELITALVAAYELGEVIGEAVGKAHYALGFHPTGTVNVFATAFVTARLMELDREQTWMALRVAATQAAGLKSMFGSMGKPLHGGRAASTGVLSARLASRGFVAGTDGISGPLGFIDALGSPPAVTDRSDRPWQILDVKFKKHAACFGTYAVVDAMTGLRADGWRPEDVTAVELTVSPGIQGVCSFEEPHSEMQTKFSPAWTGAIALSEGYVSLDTLPTWSDPETHRVASSATVQFDASMIPLQASVRLTNARGEQAVRDADVSGRDWTSSVDELADPLTSKFRAVAARGTTRGSADEILGTVLDLENVKSARHLTELLGAV